MPQMSPQAAAARWKQNFASSGPKLMEGVMAVTVNPGEKAALRADAMLAGIQQAVSSGKWQASLRATSLPQWQAAMKNKTVPRLVSGAASGEAKMASFMTQWLPYEANLVASLPARGDLATNIARATAVMQGNAQFQYVRPGG